MSEQHPMPQNPMPQNPMHDPEQAVDALEERLWGAPADQERDDESDESPDDGAEPASTPVADEPPA